MSMEYSQSGPLGDVQIGKRLREQLSSLGGGEGPDLGQGGDAVDVPDEPGPALAGRTPLVGSVRRSNGMPVVRDQLSGMMD